MILRVICIDVCDRAVSNNDKMILIRHAFREFAHCEPAPCDDDRKMYRIVVLLMCYHALSQPVTDDPSTRHVRQLIECCPCPRDEDQPMLDDKDQLTRASGVDDCPCRPRGADSEGAPSIFFPSTVRADGPQMGPTDAKEDPKNLLEPEVTLATSVLATLREATEEEYRDALAREAVRNTAEPDAVPEESARNVVFIVNPRDSNSDEYISEATHVHESRCIHPLEGISFDKVRSSSKPINVLPETLLFPKFKRPDLVLHRNPQSKDSELGASNAEESVVDINGNSQRFQSHTPILKYTTALKNRFKNNDNTLSLEKPKSCQSKLDKHEPSHLDGLKLSFTPKLEADTSSINNDLSLAPISVQQQLGVEDDKSSQLFKHTKLPLHLRNLLKLRDVELIPKTIRKKPLSKPKLDISKFTIPTFLEKNLNKNILRKNSYQETKSVSNLKTAQDTRNNEKISEQNTSQKPSNIANEDLSSESNKNIFEDCESILTEGNQENLDTLPSPSEVQTSVISVDDIKETRTNVDLPELTKPTLLCDSLEDKELENTMESQVEKIQNDSKEMISVLAKPDTITVLPEEKNNEENSQSLENEFSQSQILKINEDLETDSSNNISNLVPLDRQEQNIDFMPQYEENDQRDVKLPCDQETDLFREVKDKMTSKNLEKTLTNKQMPLNIIESSGLRETLLNLRENVVKQIENLKKPSIKSESSKRNNIDKSKVEKESEKNIANDNLAQNFNDDNAKTINSDANDNKSNISMNDLQVMSDKLFESSSKNQLGEVFSKAADCESKTVKIILKTNNLNSDNDDNQSSGTKLDSTDIENYFSNETNSKHVDECSVNPESRNVGKENTPKSANQDSEINEMDTGASDTVINTLPGILDSLNSKLRNPLLEDLVLQSPNAPLNLLGKPLGNVLNLKTNLPTLDDLRERFANIFTTNERSVEDFSSSLESDCTNDTPFENMALEASTTNSRRKLPSLKQFENFKVDAFQNKPSKSTPFKSLSKTPMLNLNNYQARVPVPSNLDLKPFNIESLLNNKPFLQLGSDKTLSRYAKPSNLLTNSLDSFPTLEELRNHLRLNTKSLHNWPVDPNLNLLTENLRSNDVEDMAKNIRLNTQKTMKGIQQKMKSTLRKPNKQSQLDNPFPKPQELLDDVNDKLKALHYDLSDRLSSIHENIMDSSRTKTLAEQPRKADSKNVMTNLRKNKAKITPKRLQSAASTVTTQEIDPNVRYEAKHRDFSIGPEPTNDINYKDWNKSHKFQNTAKSVLNPVRTDVPKSANPSLSYLQRTPPIRQNPTINQLLRESKPPYSLYETEEDKINFENKKAPIFRTVTSPFYHQRQPKVSISFRTTTVRPTSSSRTVVRVPDMSLQSLQTEEQYQSIFSNLNDKPSTESVSPFNHKFQSDRVPSMKSTPLRTSAPVPSSYDEEFEDVGDNFSDEKSILTNSNSKPSILREMPNSDRPKVRGNHKFKFSNSFDDRLETDIPKSAVKSPFDLKKVTENSFLSKVKNTNTRKSSKSLNNINEETEQSEMLKSPSENTDIFLQEPLKENVSYRCRMVCTKEIR